MQSFRLIFRTLFVCFFGITVLVLKTEVIWAELRQPSESPDINTIEVLNLDTAITIALTGNPTIAAAMDRVRQAKARLDQARSTYWPRLDATMSGSRLSLADRVYEEQVIQARFFNPTIDIQDPEDYYRARLFATWVLFNGFERKFQNVAARTGVDQSKTAQREVRRLLLSSVAKTYYTAQLAFENWVIARADANFNRRQFTEAQARQRSGTGSLSDELNFQVRVNAARTQEIRMEQIYESTRYALAAILGIPKARFPSHLKLARLTAETDWDMQPPDPKPLIDYALEHRPGIRRDELNLIQADLTVKIARSDYYPDINLLASVDGERPGDASLEKDDFGNTLGVALSYNLFSGGLRRANVDEAKARVAEKTRLLADTRIQISAQVRSSLTNLIAAQKQLSLQRDNARLVKEQRDLVEKEYQAGQGSLVRLNEAQRDLTATRGRLALALASVHNAWFELKTETGKILEDYPPIE